MVTMRDVAETVGVSRAAVSFVVNKRDKGVSDKLRREILQTMQDLNYRPSLLAQSLRGERTMLVAVILPQLVGDYGLSLLRDVETLANTAGYQVILAQHQGKMELFTKKMESLLGRHVDGMIISPPLHFTETPMYRELKSIKMPIVFVERDPGDDQINFVTLDVGRSIQLAVRHLAGLGHRRIALYDASPELVETKIRQMTYRMMIEELGLTYDPDLMYMSELNEEKEQYNKDHIESNLAFQMSLKEPPTAIIAISRGRAIAVFESAESMQLRIPDKLSLIAVTGLQFRDFHRAKITSVKFSYENLGRLAFNMLMEAINSEDDQFRRAYIPPTLIAGETTSQIKPV